MARPSRMLAALGIVGPVAFTAAWLRQTLVQDGYSVRNEHISGLAAPDARDPGVMVGGFLTLGASTIGFASAVEESLGGPRASGAAPLLLRVAGVSALVAGVFRRDMMLLHPPGRDPDYRQSWRNDVHDIASGVAYVCGIAAPLAIAWRAHHDPELEHLIVPAVGSSVATAGALVVLASEVLEPWSGIVQRAAVSVPFVGSIGLAVRLMRTAGRANASSGAP